ncbi:MAG: uroporphyrinogen-III synthase [Elusimicrobiota bacterium]|nr:MAG: uroporphyrinogen-III synthase [Elusimicrobiota bacterium]
MSKPLKGRTVLITRPKSVSGAVVVALRRRGATVIVSPLIKIAAPSSHAAVDRSLNSFSRYHAVVFTSSNAVESFFARARKILGHIPKTSAMIYAVGRSTAAAVAVRSKGRWRCSTFPEDARSAGLAKILRVPRAANVLIPRAERGLSLLPQALRKRGARVDVVSVYKTVPDTDGLKKFRSALAFGADIAVFASGSAARAGASDLKLSGAKAVAIGPTTASVLRSLKIEPVVSKAPTPDALAKAVILASKDLVP